MLQFGLEGVYGGAPFLDITWLVRVSKESIVVKGYLFNLPVYKEYYRVGSYPSVPMVVENARYFLFFNGVPSRYDTEILKRHLKLSPFVLCILLNKLDIVELSNLI